VPYYSSVAEHQLMRVVGGFTFKSSPYLFMCQLVSEVVKLKPFEMDTIRSGQVDKLA
jgi:hypothetical protein